MSETDKKRTGLEIMADYFGSVPPSAHDDTPISEKTVAYLFGDIWNRDGLARRDRSMITLAALITLGQEAQFRVHLKGALNSGLSRGEIEEMILHLAHYAGWPRGVSAMQIAREVFEETGADGG